MPVQTLQKTQPKASNTASRTMEVQLRPQTEAATEADSTLVAPGMLAQSRPGSSGSVAHHAQLLRQKSGDNPAARSEFVQRLQGQYGNHYVQRVLAVARKEENDSEVAPEIEESIQWARGGGQPLDQGVRRQMESTFGGGLDHVRVHTDAQSDTLNRALSARAFTVGSDIFFRESAYNPGSSSGRELIAHETTHVVQQGNGQVRTKLTVNQPGDRFEQEADAVAKSVIQAEQMATPTADAQGVATRQAVKDEEETAQPQLQRQPDGEEETAQAQLQRQPDEEEETTQAQLQRLIIQRKALDNQSQQAQADGQLRQGMSATGQIGHIATNGHSLQRACACGRATEGEGECAECRQKRLNESTTIQADRREDKISPLPTIQRSVSEDRTLAEETPANGRSQPAADRDAATREEESITSAPSASSTPERELPTDRTLTTENTKSAPAASTETQTLSTGTTTQPNLAQPPTPSSISVQSGEATTDGAVTGPQANEQAIQQASGAAQNGGTEQTGEVVLEKPTVNAPSSADVSEQPPAAALQAAGASRAQELTNLAGQVETAATPAMTESADESSAGSPEMQVLEEAVDANQPATEEGVERTVAAAAIAQQNTASASAEPTSAALSATQAQVGQLASTTVDFAPPMPTTNGNGQSASGRSASERDSDPAVLEQRRVAAGGLVNQFMGEVAGQAQEMVELGQTLPAQIQPIADTTITAIMTAVETQSATITAHIAQIRAEGESKARAARAQVAQLHKITTAAVHTATATARERIETEYNAAFAAIAEGENAQLQRIDELYAQGDVAYRAAGTTIGNEAVNLGAKRAADYRSKRIDQEDSFLDGSLTDNRCEARADAATQVAKGYHDGLIEEANKQADQAQQRKTSDIESVRATTAQAREAIRTQQTAVLNGLIATEQQSIQQAEQTKTGLLQTIDRALQATLQALIQQEAMSLQVIRDAGVEQSAVVQQVAQSTIAGLQDNTNQVVSSLVTSAQRIPTLMDGQPAPDLKTLGGIIDEAHGQLNNGMTAIQSQMDQSIVASQQSLDQMGQQILAGLAEKAAAATEQVSATGSGLMTSLTDLSQGATETFGQLQQQQADATDDMANNAIQGYQNATESMQTAFAQISQKLESGFAQNAAGLEHGLRDVLPKMHVEIDKKAEEAAGQVQPRWKSIAKWALIIAVVLVVAFVVGPLLVGLGPLATVLAGAAIGAASGAVIQIGNNLIDGKTWHEDVGQAIAAGAIGGAVGGLGGVLLKGVGSVAIRFAGDAVANVVGDIASKLILQQPISLEGVIQGALMGMAISVGVQGIGALASKVKAPTNLETPGGTGSHADTPEPNVKVDTPEGGVKVDTPETVGVKSETVEGPVVPSHEPTTKLDEPILNRPSETDSGGITPVDDVEVNTPSGRTTEPETGTPPSRQPTVGEPKIEGTAGGRTVTSEENAPNARTSHMEQAEIEPGVVAKQPSVNGHEVKVLRDGRVVRCSDCGVIRNIHAEKLDLPDPWNPGRTFRQQLDDIEAHPKPAQKALQAAELEQRLEAISNVTIVGKGATADGLPSHSPKQGWVVEVNHNNHPDTVPQPPYVLEFPDGTRIWRDTRGGPIRHESTLGPRTGRQHLEAEFFTATEHGKRPSGPRFERSHTLGQSTGFESPYGILDAPSYVNQKLQNEGIELFMRRLQATAPPNASYRVVTKTKPLRVEGLPTRRLGEIEYHVEVIHDGKVHPFFDYTIQVSGSAAHPQITASKIQFANNPVAQTHSQRVAIPDKLLDFVNVAL